MDRINYKRNGNIISIYCADNDYDPEEDFFIYF